eukprot:scaffold647861_cov37-Prasinocladus_malaysianus.AAC.1
MPVLLLLVLLQFLFAIIFGKYFLLKHQRSNSLPSLPVSVLLRPRMIQKHLAAVDRLNMCGDYDSGNAGGSFMSFRSQRSQVNDEEESMPSRDWRRLAVRQQIARAIMITTRNDSSPEPIILSSILNMLGGALLTPETPAVETNRQRKLLKAALSSDYDLMEDILLLTEQCERLAAYMMECQCEVQAMIESMEALIPGTPNLRHTTSLLTGSAADVSYRSNGSSRSKAAWADESDPGSLHDVLVRAARQRRRKRRSSLTASLIGGINAARTSVGNLLATRSSALGVSSSALQSDREGKTALSRERSGASRNKDMESARFENTTFDAVTWGEDATKPPGTPGTSWHSGAAAKGKQHMTRQRSMFQEKVQGEEQVTFRRRKTAGDSMSGKSTDDSTLNEAEAPTYNSWRCHSPVVAFEASFSLPSMLSHDQSALPDGLEGTLPDRLELLHKT